MEQDSPWKILACESIGAMFRQSPSKHQREGEDKNSACSRGTRNLEFYNRLGTFFFIPFIFLALLSRSLPPSLPVATQIPGHTAGPPPPSPSPPRYVPLFSSFFIAKILQCFLPSRRLASNCTYNPFMHSCKNKMKKVKLETEKSQNKPIVEKQQ